MTAQDKDRIECAIRHIQTAVDIDPWAVEIAVEAMEKEISALQAQDLQPTCNQIATDTISRQAAIEETWKEPSYADPLNVLTEMRDRLRMLPSVQPEIIHCKDCIWYELPSHKITENCVRWMKSNGILLPIKPDDFCSRAERRTDESD